MAVVSVTTALALVMVGLSLALINNIFKVIKSLRAARATGLKTVLVPFNFSYLSEVTRPVWEPLMHKLPASWRGDWYVLMSDHVLWNYGYNMFAAVGADTFLTVDFKGAIDLYSADPDAMSQITARKNDFPKPLWKYEITNMYGRNVVSTEGAEWRRHRKVVGPPFTEKNNHLVWDETIYQSQAMMKSLFDGAKQDISPTMDHVDPYTSYLALTVISKAGYDVRLGWKNASGQLVYGDDDGSEKDSSSTHKRDWVEGRTDGHTMSFGDALYILSKDLILILLLPKWLLKRAPLKLFNDAYDAYVNWNNYMKEMLSARRKDLNSAAATEQPNDLMTTLVRTAGGASTLFDKSAKNPAGGGGDDDEEGENNSSGSGSGSSSASLTDEEILGNAFMLIVAGHETTAGVLEHAMLMLACDIPRQRQLQTEIDRILQNRPPSSWDYERDFEALFSGLPGAVMAEALRLVPPALAPAKWCPKPQTLSLEGRTYVIPAGTAVTPSFVAVQRNPHVWPHGKRSADAVQFSGAHAHDPETDLGEFKPERWLKQNQNHHQPTSNGNATANGGFTGGSTGGSTGETATSISESKKEEEAKSLSVNTSRDNAASLYDPPRGAYLPYSAGFRACMGRRFAQVEVMAVLAVVFREYSIELAVDEWVHGDDDNDDDGDDDDAAVDAMDAAQRRAVYEKARDGVRRGFERGMEMRLTQKMRRAKIPMRFVRRGCERFA